MNMSGSKRFLNNTKRIVKGDWKVFDISNGNLIFEGDKSWASDVATGYNHYYCLPNKPIKYFIMNFLSVFDSIKESNGASYNLHTRELNPTTGYMVAIPGFEKSFDIPDTLNKFQDLVIAYAINREMWDKISTNPDKIFLGFWIHDGKLVVDLTENVDDLGTAYHLGVEHSQIAIYDCLKKADIKINIENTDSILIC